MSFSAQYAGKKPAVIERMAAPKPGQYDLFVGGGELGALTKEFLQKVAALVGDDKTLLITANGHSDSNQVSLDIKVLTVYGM